MNQLCIRMEDVSKRYPHFSLDSISLELPEGRVLGFIGANGAGKSTTIRILLGLVHQDSGSVQVLGHSMPEEQTEAKLDIGFVSEDMRLYGAATLAWHMQFVASMYPRWDQPEVAERRCPSGCIRSAGAVGPLGATCFLRRCSPFVRDGARCQCRRRTAVAS